MRKLAEDIWIVEGEAVPFFTLPYTTRMTIVRLDDGGLWLHSPIRFSEQLASQLSALGVVKYLIAPNHLHHLFIGEWQGRYPNASTYGTEQVINKRGDLVFDGALTNSANMHWPWQEFIEQTLFTGSPAMQECVFFHKKSAVLIVTDLVENFSIEHFSCCHRLIAKGVGILAPDGRMPIDWRLSFMFGRAEARDHLASILNWQPKVLVMAHGEIVETEATAFLKRSFRWLSKAE
ncbi:MULTISPECIES: DUF4336 domain-containing protein [unclassified Agarivorans]|uniref:DUF4336 domain-containing protein n=1 Tax=unclassified Agarivorans TaxID=2636026 RepID=UPI0026E31294|nr:MULTISPECIES: DUF4336 domain-containing protein [unclassified Agarivorans]MDO6684824.1 DUF4336 domain-containing protein [Agarivorans sp. 3_MG-2023]MDO6715015.1 DUF4336 domain-containing protein [Agarivorans sp. 2_MG-2023]